MKSTTHALDPLSKLPQHTGGGHLDTKYVLESKGAPYTTNLQWNPVSDMEISGFESKPLPLGQRFATCGTRTPSGTRRTNWGTRRTTLGYATSKSVRTSWGYANSKSVRTSWGTRTQSL
ncbi:hypothetical protein AVEN_55557-1 [Araneus ventricosus]|uniref:Uncharacterized protein n=1 Tax=Araneus ventricosus TaxID=182803 RepID=A0A4Y2FZI4_ARAVE|nr:hypothetical protein AVEN_55557-1 [Araneus ventricosus]